MPTPSQSDSTAEAYSDWPAAQAERMQLYELFVEARSSNDLPRLLSALRSERGHSPVSDAQATAWLEIVEAHLNAYFVITSESRAFGNAVVDDDGSFVLCVAAVLDPINDFLNEQWPGFPPIAREDFDDLGHVVPADELLAFHSRRFAPTVATWPTNPNERRLLYESSLRYSDTTGVVLNSLRSKHELPPIEDADERWQWLAIARAQIESLESAKSLWFRNNPPWTDQLYLRALPCLMNSANRERTAVWSECPKLSLEDAAEILALLADPSIRDQKDAPKAIEYWPADPTERNAVHDAWVLAYVRNPHPDEHPQLVDDARSHYGLPQADPTLASRWMDIAYCQMDALCRNYPQPIELLRRPADIPASVAVVNDLLRSTWPACPPWTEADLRHVLERLSQTQKLIVRGWLKRSIIVVLVLVAIIVTVSWLL